MQFQYRGNSYIRGNSWKRIGQNETGEDKGGERMENTNKSQRHWKFPQICQFLLMLYPQFQSHSKTIK